VHIYLELFVTNYSSKKMVKENTLPNCNVIFFIGKNHLFENSLYIPEIRLFLKLFLTHGVMIL